MTYALNTIGTLFTYHRHKATVAISHARPRTRSVAALIALVVTLVVAKRDTRTFGTLFKIATGTAGSATAIVTACLPVASWLAGVRRTIDWVFTVGICRTCHGIRVAACAVVELSGFRPAASIFALAHDALTAVAILEDIIDAAALVAHPLGARGAGHICCAIHVGTVDISIAIVVLPVRAVTFVGSRNITATSAAVIACALPLRAPADINLQVVRLAFATVSILGA